MSSTGRHLVLLRARLGTVQNARGWWRWGYQRGGEGAEKRETVTASHGLAFAGLVAPATATADWSKGQ